MNIFRHVQCRWNNFEIISDVVACEIKHWNNLETISVLYFACNHRQWLHVKYNTEIISKLFHNNFISHVTTALDSVWQHSGSTRYKLWSDWQRQTETSVLIVTYHHHHQDHHQPLSWSILSSYLGGLGSRSFILLSLKARRSRRDLRPYDTWYKRATKKPAEPLTSTGSPCKNPHCSTVSVLAEYENFNPLNGRGINSSGYTLSSRSNLRF